MPKALSCALSLKSNKIQMGKISVNRFKKNKEYAGCQGFSVIKKGSADVTYAHIRANNKVLAKIKFLR